MSEISIVKEQSQNELLAKRVSQNSASFVQHKDLDTQESQIIRIDCFKKNIFKLILYIMLSLTSGGIFNLLCYWKPLWLAKCMYSKCNSEVANVLSIKNEDGLQENIKVKTINLQNNVIFSNKSFSGNIQIFKYRFLRYFNDVAQNQFLPVFYESEQKFKDIKSKQPYTPIEVDEMKKVFGQCKMEIKVPNILILLQKEILTPFYLFQFGAFILWMFEEYLTYAFCLLFVSFVGCALNLYQTRKNLVNLQRMTQQTTNVYI